MTPTAARKALAEEFIDWAIEYGVAVAWSKNLSTKGPMQPGWQKSPPAIERNRADLLKLAKGHNLGVSAQGSPGLIVAEADSAEDLAAVDALDLGPALRIISGHASGERRHLYWSTPTDWPTDAPRWFKFEGGRVTHGSGFFVGYGSVHPDSGLFYRAEGDRLHEPPLLNTGGAARLLATVTQSRQETKERAADPTAKLTEGERHAHFLTMSRELALLGKDAAFILNALLYENENACEVPKPNAEGELTRIAETAVERYGNLGEVDRMLAGGPAPELREEHPDVSASLESIDDYRAESVVWLPGFEELIPMGELMNLIAPGGTGKGLLTALVAKNVPAGRPILYSGSEDNASRLKQRLDAAGVKRGRFLRAWGPKGPGDQLTFPTDVGWVRRLIEHSNACILVIDSGAGHLDPGFKNDKVEDVDQVVKPLALVCEQTGCTVLNILHPPKSGDMLTGLGSGAWVNTARHSLFMVRDDEESDLVHVIVHKSNLGTTGYGRTYRFHMREVKLWNRELEMTADVEVPYLVWEDDSTKSALDLLKKQASGGVSRGGKQQAAYDLLRERLTVEGSDGDTLKREVASQVGCGGGTVWLAWKKLQHEGVGEYHFETTGEFGSGAQKHIWRLKTPTDSVRGPHDLD